MTAFEHVLSSAGRGLSRFSIAIAYTMSPSMAMVGRLFALYVSTLLLRALPFTPRQVATNDRTRSYRQKTKIEGKSGVYHALTGGPCRRLLDNILKKKELFDRGEISSATRGPKSTTFQPMQWVLYIIPLNPGMTLRAFVFPFILMNSEFCYGGPRLTLSKGLSANRIRHCDRLPG